MRLYDVNFVGSDSSSLYYAPKHFRWARSGPNTPVTFCTDYCLDEGQNSNVRIAWVLEPEAINPEPYRRLAARAGEYSLVLTHSAELIRLINRPGEPDRALFYPNGMSWIAPHDWRMHPKSRSCSIIASSKAMTEGHQMRHRIIAKAGSKLDVFGRGYRPVEHKVEALGPYRFSVTIENSSAAWYFTEKLLDCFATFTVPIYWGCPGIARFFDTAGMIVVSNEEEIFEALERLDEDLYRSMMPAIERNHEAARVYRLPEDWIFDNILLPRGLV